MSSEANSLCSICGNGPQSDWPTHPNYDCDGKNQHLRRLIRPFMSFERWSVGRENNCNPFSGKIVFHPAEKSICSLLNRDRWKNYKLNKSSYGVSTEWLKCIARDQCKQSECGRCSRLCKRNSVRKCPICSGIHLLSQLWFPNYFLTQGHPYYCTSTRLKNSLDSGPNQQFSDWGQQSPDSLGPVHYLWYEKYLSWS